MSPRMGTWHARALKTIQESWFYMVLPQIGMVATQNDQSICDATSPSKSLTHSHVISVCIEFLVGQLQHVGLNGPRRNGCPEGAGSCVRAVQEQLESHLSVKITRRGDSLKHHGSNLDLILSQHIHRSMDGVHLT